MTDCARFPSQSDAIQRYQRRPRGVIMIEATSAITLATHDMPRAVRFYSSLGFDIRYGGETASFTSFCAGPTCLNLIAQGEEKQWSWWGRVIFHVSDVDAVYEQA